MELFLTPLTIESQENRVKRETLYFDHGRSFNSIRKVYGSSDVKVLIEWNNSKQIDQIMTL